MTAPVDIKSDAFIAEANAELATKPCPVCATVGTASVSRKFLPSRFFSLSGAQDKMSGSFELVLECSHCGVQGRLSQDG